MYITKISHGKAVLLTKCRIFVFSLVGIGKKKVDPMRTQLFYFAHVSSWVGVNLHLPLSSPFLTENLSMLLLLQDIEYIGRKF